MNISDEIDNLLGALSAYSDDEIQTAIFSMFKEDMAISDLDASGLYTLLLNKKQNAEGMKTTWFDMETL